MKEKTINHLEFEDLLKNLQDALNMYSIKELNNALLGILNKEDPKKPLVNAVINSVCQVFDVSRRVLVNSSARGQIQDARMIAHVILHNELNLTTRYISLHIFNKRTHGSVMHSLRTFKGLTPEKINYHKELLEKYKRAKELTLNKLISKK